MSGNSALFEDLPEQPVPEAPGRGTPRLRQPQRHQPGWQIVAIDDLVARDHPVRAVWGFVQGLDLCALHDAVKAREGVPGQAPAAPELMMALWLWATVDGVGSARQLTRMCEQHLAYRWLCGGVSMNYHTLSDFRVAHAAVLDQLLAGGVAALVAQGLVALDVLAQDGLRVRAAAGAGSFRRRERLGKLAAAAKARVERLRAELEADPAAGDRRQQAAQQRAAREREQRVKAALDRMSEIEDPMLSAHLELLIDSGLVNGKIARSHGARGDVISVEGLTWQGHEWIEMVRSQALWNETKRLVVEQGGALTFELTKAVAGKLLRARLGLPPG